ncbi:TRAP transporter small permease [Cytobacillus horneckiae]|uniref:TRAP transporter small permease n=1 Tax=Cytobacillus horneckiae TaxID=549687 RepID=A0A2N0ZKQ8_9BACI|nr:TRAP transporter small permease [Cytobacillus horneckiae]MEC1156389.1 TRAP transporter small permease [Cytobacillus horneckiae]MED2938406.1 TRAP transporter small permease [Cytobacillus horneckiae]PKG30087.1 TRAP transporter small permease [Cytobacillus horneckiae]
MKKMYQFTDRLINAGAYLSGLFIILTTLMIFYEIISRVIFGQPTIWATELSIYAIIGSCFLGSAYGVRNYSHITVDLLVNNVNDRYKTVLAYLSNALGLVFSIIFTFYGFHHVAKTYELGIKSASLLRIPMYLPELFLPIGGILLCLAFIMQIIDGGIHEGGEHI